MINGDGVGKLVWLRQLIRFAMILLLPVARPLDPTLTANRATRILREVRDVVLGINFATMNWLLFIRRGVSARRLRGVAICFLIKICEASPPAASLGKAS